MIQAKRHTGLKQWNELLRWAFCISLANPSRPKLLQKLDTGIEPVEWQTFAGESSQVFAAAFRQRAAKDKIRIDDNDAITRYFRAHIERGVAALRTVKSLRALTTLPAQIERSRSTS